MSLIALKFMLAYSVVCLLLIVGVIIQDWWERRNDS